MRVVKFIIGGLFIITALGMFAQKEIVAGLFAGILGAVILPPVSDSLKEKFKFWQSKGVRYVGYFVLLALVGITSDNYKFKQKMEVAEQKAIENEQKSAENEKSETETAGNGVKAGVYNANGEKVGVKSINSYTVLREWNPDNDEDAIGMEILINKEDATENGIKSLINSIVNNKDKALIQIYTSEKAFNEGISQHYTDEYKKSYIAF